MDNHANFEDNDQTYNGAIHYHTGTGSSLTTPSNTYNNWKYVSVGCNITNPTYEPIKVQILLNGKVVGQTNINSNDPINTVYRCYIQVGNLTGTPTYLETLDKMDQWSSVQYVPYPRNRNELNHL